MRLTERKLKRMIKEEISSILNEVEPPASGGWRKGTGSSSDTSDVETRKVHTWYGTPRDKYSIVEIKNSKHKYGINGAGLLNPIGFSREGVSTIMDTIRHVYNTQSGTKIDKPVGNTVDRSQTTVNLDSAELSRNNEKDRNRVRLSFAGQGSSKASNIASGMSGKSPIYSVHVRFEQVSEFLSVLDGLY